MPAGRARVRGRVRSAGPERASTPDPPCVACAREGSLLAADPYVRGMAAIRLLSASIEVTGALLILRFGRVDTALRINGLLGLVGPTILVGVTLLGVAGLAGRIVPAKIAIIFIGVYLILYGSRA
jgi:hypothetical protein